MFVKNPEYFLAIVKERSISKAADRLYLSQPYLSQYLAKLEANLGVTLLDRSHTPLRLTAAGELFHAYLERQGYLDRQLESDLQQLQEKKRQQLHIGVSTWRGSTLLPDILPRFAAKYPDVQVVLHEAPVPQLGNLAASSVTDFCLMHTPGNLTDLSYELVMMAVLAVKNIISINSKLRNQNEGTAGTDIFDPDMSSLKEAFGVKEEQPAKAQEAPVESAPVQETKETPEQ